MHDAGENIGRAETLTAAKHYVIMCQDKAKVFCGHVRTIYRTYCSYCSVNSLGRTVARA
jgi:hypothetical protein